MPAHTTARDEILNQLTDADPLWGPFLFLRPARQETFGGGRLLLVCSLFGIFYGMCLNLALALALAHSERVIPVYAAPLFLSLTAFICGQLFSGAWNRRANQIHRRLAWAQANQRQPRRR